MKTHGNCTPHAQWDHPLHTICGATRAIDPYQAPRPSGLQKGKITIGSGSARRVMTSVVRFIKETELGSVFDDQATKAMGEAFDAACKVLDKTGQSSVVYEAVAKCIIEIAKSGERDPNQLRDRALTACGHKRLISLLPRT
jgi:hypothetical protein